MKARLLTALVALGLVASLAAAQPKLPLSAIGRDGGRPPEVADAGRDGGVPAAASDDAASRRESALRADVDRLRSELIELRTRLAAVEQRAARADELQSRLDEQKTRVDALTQRLDEADQRAEEKSRRIAERKAAFEQANASLVTALDRLTRGDGNAEAALRAAEASYTGGALSLIQSARAAVANGDLNNARLYIELAMLEARSQMPSP